MKEDPILCCCVDVISSRVRRRVPETNLSILPLRTAANTPKLRSVPVVTVPPGELPPLQTQLAGENILQTESGVASEILSRLPRRSTIWSDLTEIGYTVCANARLL